MGNAALVGGPPDLIAAEQIQAMLCRENGMRLSTSTLLRCGRQARIRWIIGRAQTEFWLKCCAQLCVVLLVGSALRAGEGPVEPSTQVAGKPGTNLVDQVGRLLQSGTDQQVVLSFIQTWSRPYLTSSDDLLTLKRRGASSEVLTAFARRGAELRFQAFGREDANASGTNFPQVVFVPIPYRSEFLAPVSEQNDSPYLFSDLLRWRAEEEEFAINGFYLVRGWWGPWRRGSFHR